jgi:septum formation protein
MSNIILGSASPRRKELLESVVGPVEILSAKSEEIIPQNIPYEDIPMHLSQSKANEIASNFNVKDKILITADTLVFLDDQILGKPKNKEDAYKMISSLSGNTHEVITGVTMWYHDEKISFIDRSKVVFLRLNEEDIEYYIRHYEVLDKAGAYGVQDFIGMIGIEKIEGSYYNIMGLPVHKVFPMIKKWSN